MNFDKFTQKAQMAILECQNIGIQEGHQQLDGEHLHLALMKMEDGLIPKLLTTMNVKVYDIEAELQDEIDKLPKVHGGNENMYYSRRFNQLLINAEKIADQFKDEYVSVEHLYMALLDEKNTPSAKIFSKYNITKDRFLQELTKVRGNQRVTSQNPEENYDALNKYGSEQNT